MPGTTILQKVQEINKGSYDKQKEIAKKRAETILAERIKNQHSRRGPALAQRVSGLQKLGSTGSAKIKKGLDLKSLLGGS